MNEPALTAPELIAWVEKTSNGWRKLLANHPELLAVPCDINSVQTVGQLLQHIVAVEQEGKGSSFSLVYVRTHGKDAEI